MTDHPTDLNPWQPTASISMLRKRAQLFQQIRDFFLIRNVMEVDTPYLSQAAVADPLIDPVACQVMAIPAYLHTSPEYPMKRLLCAGSGDIYFMGKVFRNGEAGKKHNPEFTMLEWYRVGWDETQLIDEVIDLLVDALGEKPVKVMRYKDLFLQCFDIDVLSASEQAVSQLGKTMAGQDLELDRAGWLDYLMSHHVEPSFDPNVFTVLCDFPKEQAALAKTALDHDGELVAKRFEVYVAGVELANGYCELTDYQEQTHRFDQDQKARQQSSNQCLPTDHLLLTAMKQGMPNCAGVALGVDRLLMIQQQVTDIREVLSFSWERS